MKKRNLLSYFVILAIAVGGVAAQQTTAQTPKPANEKQSSGKLPKKRAIPFKGTVGKIDLEKQTFTLVNKSNKKIRTFKVTKDTKFEIDRKPVGKLAMLKPSMQVTGSCFKTGERQYTAKLVRWKTQIKTKPKPEKN